MMPHPAARTRLGDWPLAVKSILGFWLFYALTVVARAFLGSDPWTVIYNRSFTVGCGIVLTFGIYLAVDFLAPAASLRRKAVIAGAASVIAAAILSGLAIWADRFQDKPQDEIHYVSREGYHVTDLGS